MSVGPAMTVAPGSPLPVLVGAHERPLCSASFQARLDLSSASDLDGRGVVRDFRAGEVAFLQGEHPGRVGIILDGAVKLTAGDSDGRTALIDIRSAGDVIGLTEILTGGPRLSTVTALAATSVRQMPSREFRSWLDQYPCAQRAAGSVMGQRVTDSVSHRIGASDAVPSRLARCLLELASRHGHLRADGALVVALPLSQDDFALMVSASRDSVAKTLMRWRRLRIIETGRRWIVVLDVDRLESI